MTEQARMTAVTRRTRADWAIIMGLLGGLRCIVVLPYISRMVLYRLHESNTATVSMTMADCTNIATFLLSGWYFLLHFLHGVKETTSKDQCDVENNQGGLGKHVCSPYHLFVKVFTFPSWHNNHEPDRRERRRPGGEWAWTAYPWWTSKEELLFVECTFTTPCCSDTNG